MVYCLKYLDSRTSRSLSSLIRQRLDENRDFPGYYCALDGANAYVPFKKQRKVRFSRFPICKVRSTTSVNA